MLTPVEVKICGLTSEADAGLLIKYGADYAGMVLFYPKSRRNIDISLAETIIGLLKKSDIKTVAVVVSPTAQQVRQIKDAGFDYVQIHGDMTEDVYEACGIGIIRAVNIKSDNLEEICADVEKCRSLDKIYGLLFDAGVPGSGKTFDWNSLVKMPRTGKKMFLAGGLNADNVACAIQVVQPDAVDISSGVEYDNHDYRGKDENKVKLFIGNAKLSEKR